MPHFVYLARGRPQRPRANLIQTLHTVEAIAKAGVDVRLYVPPLPRGFDTDGFLAGMGIRHPIDLRGALTLHSQWKGWPFVLTHRRELRAADVVYTRVPDFSVLLARTGLPHFLEVHDTESLIADGLIAPLRDAAARGLLRGLAAISDAGREALMALGFAGERIAVLPSGVDLDAFNAIPVARAADFADPHALYVGRISRDRGLPLFEAIADAGFPVTLIGPLDHVPAHQSPRLRIEDPVPHAEVPAALARGAVALMPYQADLRHAATISPIKLFEAMAAGRLVIASDLPPIREVVRHGENGLLVPAGDTSAWIAAMRQVQNDPAAAQAMAEAGRLTARDYGWDARAAKLLAFVRAHGRPS
ncbi:glycosyltransferase family 4 protein [Denitromonas iodatirespirans]|uniref:Glycosyltransferase family 4 protein n=1 Tax=Denitromonas iodatirespirans TaxID=2795389 RepID=A0A944HBL7_DENI1|nr:glycosyltransferase family 4 protein [Denitromonas iodatirespirans]MBT0961792.1 glycosyltransferase family 4 protein [Denitromonas iodatirespirans]